MFRERLLRSYWSRTSRRATYRISHFGIALHVVQRIGYCAHPPTQAQARDELRRRTETEDEEQATTIKVGLSASRGIYRVTANNIIPYRERFQWTRCFSRKA